MPFSAKAVANEFIYIAGGQLTPMKLQKLVYFAHGWYLAITGSPLVSEDIEAWQFGPVISGLYHEFKSAGSGNVMSPASQMTFTPDGKVGFVTPRIDGTDDVNHKQALDVIRQVWEAYGKYSARSLSNVTHNAGSPWSQTYREGVRSQVISNELIRDYFRSLQK